MSAIETKTTENVLETIIQASSPVPTQPITTPVVKKESKKGIEIKEIPVIDVIVEKNPSRAYGVAQEDVDARVREIKEMGLQVPIIVYQKEDKYLLLAGEHRLSAYKQLGRKLILAQVHHEKISHAIVSFVENFCRKAPSAIDTARQYKALKDEGFKQRAIAKKAGVSEAHVSQLLNLYENTIEGFKQAIHDGECPYALVIKYVLDLPEGNQEAYFKALGGDYSEASFRLKLAMFKPAQESTPEPSAKVDSVKEEHSKNEEKGKSEKSNNKEPSAAGAGVRGETKARTAEHARVIKEVVHSWVERKYQEWDEKFPQNRAGEHARARLEGVMAFLPLVEKWLADPNALVGQSQGELLNRMEQVFRPKAAQ